MTSLSAHAQGPEEKAHRETRVVVGYIDARYPMSEPKPPDVTQLLKAWSNGDRHVVDQLFTAIYDELRRLARSRLARERRSHTWQPTDLVHEAFARLVAQKVSWQNRHHFYGIAAECMRRVLVDHARKKKAAKRPSSAAAVPLDEELAAGPDSLDRILIVDEALTRLTQANPRQARVVELKIFGGLSIEEIAAAAGISPATVKRDWEEAKQAMFDGLQSRP
jgi:RNA polymerase sigma factor (TIGR02999 family)